MGTRYRFSALSGARWCVVDIPVAPFRFRVADTGDSPTYTEAKRSKEKGQKP